MTKIPRTTVERHGSYFEITEAFYDASDASRNLDIQRFMAALSKWENEMRAKVESGEQVVFRISGNYSGAFDTIDVYYARPETDEEYAARVRIYEAKNDEKLASKARKQKIAKLEAELKKLKSGLRSNQ